MSTRSAFRAILLQDLYPVVLSRRREPQRLIHPRVIRLRLSSRRRLKRVDRRLEGSMERGELSDVLTAVVRRVRALLFGHVRQPTQPARGCFGVGVGTDAGAIGSP